MLIGYFMLMTYCSICGDEYGIIEEHSCDPAVLARIEEDNIREERRLEGLGALIVVDPKSFDARMRDAERMVDDSK